MVSLERESASSRGSAHGGYFFDNESPVGTDDEQHLVSEHNTTENTEPRYRMMWTIPIAVGEIVLLIVYMVLPFLVPYAILPSYPEYKTDFDKMEKMNLMIMVILQVCVWLVITIITGTYHFFHIRHQRFGYLEFYRDTRVYKEVPGFIFSVGNAIMLVVPMLVYSHNLADPGRDSILWPSNYFQIVFLIQSLPSIPCVIKYILLVKKFNKDKLPPDIEVDDYFHMVSRPCVNFPQIGFKEATYLDNLLERQADMILYLRRHIDDLSKRLLQLGDRQAIRQQMNSIT